MKTQAVISPDGKVIATGGRLPGLRFWDAKSGRPLHQPVFPVGIGGLAFSPDSKSLLTSPPATMYDVASGRETRRYAVDTGQSVVAYSPDGKLFAGDNAGTGIDIVSVATGQRLGLLLGHKSYLYSLAFSPNSKTLASASRDKSVILWDVAAGKELRRFEERGEAHRVAFSPDGKLLAWAGDEGLIRIGKVDATEAPLRFESFAGAVHALAFAPDSKTIVYGGADGTLSIREATWKLRKRWTAHVYPVISVGFFPDGRTLASLAGQDGAVRLWNAATGEALHARTGHTGRVEALRLSADGKTLRSFGRDLRGLEWDLDSGKETKVRFERRPEFPARAWPAGMAVSRDANVIAVGGWYDGIGKSEHNVHFCDARSGKHIGLIAIGPGLSRDMALSPDGQLLATSVQDSIQLWDVRSKKKLADLKKSHKESSVLAFSPSGKILASAGDDGTVRLWDVAARKIIRHFEHVELGRASLLFSDDERLLIAGGSPTRIWDISTGKLYRLFPPEDALTFLALSPNGRHLASAGILSIPQADGYDRFVGRTTVWELASGKVAYQLADIDGVIWSLAFTPDGRSLATGGADSVIHLWDLTSGRRERKPLTARELTQAWDDLGSDAAKGWRAVWSLVAAPQAVPFLKEKLRPIAPADPAQIERCLVNLKSERLATRAEAADELAVFGERAEAALRKAIAKPVALDFRARVERLLSRLTGPITDPDRLRMVRAVEALESIGTPAARELLDTLGGGVAESLLTREARAASARLAAQRCPL